MSTGYKANEAKQFVVTVVFRARDDGFRERDTYVVGPDETVKGIFDRIIPKIDAFMGLGGYPETIELTPDLSSKPNQPENPFLSTAESEVTF
jgi:hypothetical protein